MTTYNNETVSSWNSMFKKSYADAPANIIPDNVILARRIPNVSYSATPGGIYEVPVILTRSSGATKAPANSDIFNLNNPIAMGVKSGQVEGSQFVSRMAFSYELLSRSENSPNKFESATKSIVASHLADAWFYQECDILHGRSAGGIGLVSSTTATSIVITEASFAPGIWIGNDTKEIIVESAAGVYRGSATIQGIDIETKTLTIDALPAGTVATDVIRWKADGVAGANSFIGITKMAQTSTGTLFNIPVTSYSMWKPIGSVALGNVPLTFAKILYLLNKPVARGLGSVIREAELYVSSKTYSNLCADEAAKRKYDYSYKSDKAIAGTEYIEYYSQAGSLKVIPHHMMKYGEALLVPKPERAFSKVGSQSTPTFNLPGQQKASGSEAYLFPIPNAAGVEARLYYNTSLFSQYISQILHITGITNADI